MKYTFLIKYRDKIIDEIEVEAEDSFSALQSAVNEVESNTNIKEVDNA